MAERGTGGKASTRLTASVVAGLLLVPASAIAAVAIVGATSSSPSEETFDAATSTSLLTTTTMATVTADQVVDIDEDHISEACTTDADNLLELEEAGSLTDLQAAALDALREICAEHDMTIAGPPAVDTVVKVVTVQEPTTTTMDDSSSDGTYDDHSEGEYEGEYEDDDHHGEDDDHHGEDHEDHDDETEDD